MAGHIYKYRLKNLVKDKSLVFWTTFFPIILATFFFAAFGQMTSAEGLKAIPTAVVYTGDYEAEDALKMLFQTLEAEDVLSISGMTMKDAVHQLDDGKINGIIEVSDALKLHVAREGMNESILKQIMDAFIQTEGAVREAMVKNPEAAEKIMEGITQKAVSVREVSVGGRTMDTMLQYFYILIGMACMYGGFYGIANAVDIQANLSPIAQRRNLAPVHKLKISVIDFAAAVTVHMATLTILILWLLFVLRLDFQINPAYMFLTCLLGSCANVGLGMLIGALLPLSEGVKTSIIVGVSLTGSFLGGMMFSGMRVLVDTYCPIVNRLNPAALLADSFYAMDVYDDLGRYITDLEIMGAIAVVMCIGSFLIVRRRKYASL